MPRLPQWVQTIRDRLLAKPDGLTIDPASVGTMVPRSAWIEMALFLGIALVIDTAILGGNRFWSVSPHPFWIVVLLLSIQYGTSAGLVAVVASSLVLLVGNLPEQRIDQDYYTYLFDLVSAPLGWAVSALTLGELRRRQMTENARLRLEVAEATLREDSLARAYGRVTKLNERLETRVAAQLKTVFTIFTAAQAVEQLQVGAVLVGVEDLVQELLSPTKFSLYVLNRNTLEAVIAEGWADDDPFLTRIEASHDLFRALIGERRILCVANPVDELVLGGQGVLAGPIVHEHTGEVLAVLKIEDMGFLDLHLSTVENFKIICEWVGSAYAKAEEYETSQFSLGRGAMRHLMPVNTLTPLASWLSGLAFRAKFELWQMTVSIQRLEGVDMRAVNKDVGSILMRFLRTTDLPFASYGDYTQLQALLPATAAVGIPVVIRKMEEAFRTELPPERGFPEVRVEVRNLYHVPEDPPSMASTPGGGTA